MTSVPDVLPSSGGSNEPFRNAHRTFLESLAPRDRAALSACSSPDDLTKLLEALQNQATRIQKRSIGRCLTVFKNLNDKLQPYFDMLNVVAGANANSALAYGALRLILQLASGLPSFFEKLLGLLNRLGEVFPQYDAVVKIFDGMPPPRMRQHLENVYQDLFEFLQMAARIFTASNGKIKRPLGMMATVIWKPFDQRFSSLLIRMDHHRKFVLDELDIVRAERARDADRAAVIERARAEHERQQAASARETARTLECATDEMKTTLEREATESSRQRVLEWLAPPPSAETLESIEREEGTAQWVFNHLSFKEWVASIPKMEEGIKRKDMPPWVLWVHGNPGCGKTVLASSMIETAMEDGFGESTKTCYFFFKYGDPQCSTVEAAYRSALAQLLCHNRNDTDLLDKFSFSRSDHSTASGQLTATSRELLDLIRITARVLGCITLILDGIDESNDPDLVGLKLKELASTAPIKLVCFSRPNVSQDLVVRSRRVEFDRNTTNSDIKLFLTNNLQELVEEGKLPPTVDVSELVETLVYGADGMFLWAKLMVKHLRCRALNATSRLRTIRAVRYPEGLNTIYDRIVVFISKSERPEMDLARRVLLWLNHSFTHRYYHDYLTNGFLQSALGDDTIEDFASVVVSVCAGLVEFMPQRGFRFIHLTVMEYFASVPWSRIGLTSTLFPDQARAAAEITTRCLRHLIDHAPAQNPAKSSRNLGLFDAKDLGSFESYAVINWTEHLSHTILGQLSLTDRCSADTVLALGLQDSMSQFLGNPLAVGFWIEGLYWRMQEPVPRIILHLKCWSDQFLSLDPRNPTTSKLRQLEPQLQDLAVDISDIDAEWSSKLLTDPTLIWDDILIFHGHGILSKLRDLSSSAMVTLASDAPKREDGTSLQCLCTISVTSSDGMLMGVLAVYSSPGFEGFWKKLNPATAYYRDAESFCAGWTARYELWSLDSARLASFSIELPKLEILILLRQSFREERWNQHMGHFGERLALSFPSAINHDCRTFALLRTVYGICPTESGINGAMRSCTLPLESLDHYESKWTLRLDTFNPGDVAHLNTAFGLAWRDWYTYSISFSPNGRYLSFADYQKPCITHLVVFEICYGDPFRARLVRSTMARLGPPRVSQMKFHPQYSLIAFLCEVKVWVWDFNGESKPAHLPISSERCPICHMLMTPWDFKSKRAACKCNTDNADPEGYYLDSLTFSLCGKYLVAKTKNDTVHVLQIPQEMVNPKDQKQVGDTSSVPYVERSSNQVSRSSLQKTLGGYGLLPGAILPGTHLVSAPKEVDDPNVLVLTAAGNDIKAKSVTQGTSENNRHLRLLSMPKSFNCRNSAISIKIPERLDDPVRIMMNKRPEEGYSLSDGKEAQFPTIVEREFTSIKQVENLKRTCLDHLPDAHFPPLEGDKPQSKRLKETSE